MNEEDKDFKELTDLVKDWLSLHPQKYYGLKDLYNCIKNKWLKGEELDFLAKAYIMTLISMDNETEKLKCLLDNEEHGKELEELISKFLNENIKLVINKKGIKYLI